MAHILMSTRNAIGIRDDAAWTSLRETPKVCQSRSGHWRPEHEYDRDGICYWCSKRDESWGTHRDGTS